MDEYLNTEALGTQFRQSDVYDNTETNLPNTGKGFPCSRGKDNDRGANVQNSSRLAQRGTAKGGMEIPEMQT